MVSRIISAVCECHHMPGSFTQVFSGIWTGYGGHLQWISSPTCFTINCRNTTVCSRPINIGSRRVLAQTDWHLHNNFENPPFFLIPQVLDLVLTEKAEATLIAPVWKGQPWFQKLQTMAIAPPLVIPRRSIIRERNVTPEPLKHCSWTLCALKISGNIA